MEFIGRSLELNKLNNIINKKTLTFSLIYGRRRIGKTELVKNALSKIDGIKIYYECKQVQEMSNVAGLSDVLAEALNLPKIQFDNFESILKYIFELSITKKVILVIDEYPYLKESIKGIDSILQSLIDSYKDKSMMSFIILGSYVDIMKSLLEHSNPLYGRVDLTINLKPMDYYDSSLFYPSFSNEDKVKIYSVFGGIPYYNKLIDDKKTVRENIIELVASEDARLENEISMYLNSEISKINNANEVFITLAKGYTRFSDILSQSHVSSSPTLVDVLEKLVKMEVVEKITPINESFSKKKTGYYISDNLSMFYYRYIFKYSSQLKLMDSNIFYDKYIKDDFLNFYVPHAFESICKEYLIRENKKGKINPPFENIGKFYYDDPINKTNGEFDILTKDELGYVFYEVKFKDKPINEDIINKEIEQVNNCGLSCYKYVFISKSGFDSKKRDNVEFIDLIELYE